MHFISDFSVLSNWSYCSSVNTSVLVPYYSSLNGGSFMDKILVYILIVILSIDLTAVTSSSFLFLPSSSIFFFLLPFYSSLPLLNLTPYWHQFIIISSFFFIQLYIVMMLWHSYIFYFQSISVSSISVSYFFHL